jgi:replication factor A1
MRTEGVLLSAAMGRGGWVEVDLLRGAVAAMSRMAEGLRPVLQVADAPRPAGERYRLLLSDGVHSQQGLLAASLNRLVRDGDLRRGTVVRVLDYICSAVRDQR